MPPAKYVTSTATAAAVKVQNAFIPKRVHAAPSTGTSNIIMMYTARNQIGMNATCDP
jgi:hypothetical protein